VIVNALGISEETLQPIYAEGTPAVLVDRTVEGVAADMVGLDNDAAVRLGMQHLFERGFDDICFIVQPYERISSRRLREAAFRAALAQAKHVGPGGTSGGQGVTGRTIVVDLADADAVNRAYAELDAHLAGVAAGSRKRIALFAANGPVALSLALHLHARYGVHWQAHAALIAIDDSEWAELVGVTTIRQPTYAIGYRAVEFLHERIEGGTDPVREAMLPGELIARVSTGAC